MNVLRSCLMNQITCPHEMAQIFGRACFLLSLAPSKQGARRLSGYIQGSTSHVTAQRVNIESSGENIAISCK
jgi:hypothetical protein